MAPITQKIKGTISDTFNKSAHHRSRSGEVVAEVRTVSGMRWELPYLEFSQPPVDFEKKTGLTGISCGYFLPPDLLPRELQEYGMISLADNCEAHQRLSEVWSCLKETNPSTLGSLKFDENNTRQLYHAVLGVASAFLPQDIQAWLDGWTGIELRKDKEAVRMLNKIETLSSRVEWIPSKPTLREMVRQIENGAMKPATTKSRRASPHHQPAARKATPAKQARARR